MGSSDAALAQHERWQCEVPDCGNDIEYPDVRRCREHGGECDECGSADLRRDDQTLTCNDCGADTPLSDISALIVLLINGEQITTTDTDWRR